MTLIELVGVVSIIALLFTAVTLSMSNVVRADLKAEASKLSSTIQAVYNRSATRNAYYRMVFDLEEGEYWSELAEKRFFIGQGKEEDEPQEGFKEKDHDAQQAGKVQILETAEGPAMHRASGDEVKDALVRRVKLGRGLSLGGLMTTHQRDVRRDGRGYIYFFPNGYVERALIYLTDGDAVYTVATQPLTGRTRVLRGEVAPGDEFEDQDDDD